MKALIFIFLFMVMAPAFSQLTPRRVIRQEPMTAKDVVKAVKEMYSKLHLLIQSDNRQIKIKTLETLALYKTTGAFNLIKKAVNDVDPQVRLHAIKAISGYKLKEVQDILEKAVLEDGNIYVNIEAAQALAYFNSKEGFPFLKFVFSHNNPSIRRKVVKALSLYQTKEATSSLKMALADKEPLVRFEAAAALINKERTESINEFKSGLDDPNWTVKLIASEKLSAASKHSIFTINENILFLISALKSKDPQIRLRAVNIVSDIDVEKLQHRLSLVLPDLDFDLDDVQSLLILMLEDPDIDVSLAAAVGLSPSKSEAAHKVLLSALDDEKRNIKAAKALAHFGSKEGMALLIEKIKSKDTDHIRAIEALTLYPLKGALTLRQSLLKSSDPQIQIAAAHSIGKTFAQIFPFFTGNYEKKSGLLEYINETGALIEIEKIREIEKSIKTDNLILHLRTDLKDCQDKKNILLIENKELKNEIKELKNENKTLKSKLESC